MENIQLVISVKCHNFEEILSKQPVIKLCLICFSGFRDIIGSAVESHLSLKDMAAILN